MKEFRQAAANGDLELVKRLYQEGAVTNINEDGKDSGKTALHWAAQKGHREIVQYLIGLKGLNIDVQDKDGNTPFNLLAQSTQATLTNKLLIIDCLLNNHADPLIPNKEGKTPFNNSTTYVRGQGTSNQQSYFRTQTQKIKSIISEKALALKLSAAIRRDGTVVFGESGDLVSNPKNCNDVTNIKIIGVVDSSEENKTSCP